MAVRAITVENHDGNVHAWDVGAYQARTFGPGCYVMHGCSATVVDSNTVRISEGELLIQGRHKRIVGSEDVSVRSGAVGRSRKDLIVARFAKDASGTEDITLEYLPGTPTEGAASDPAYVKGSILDGDVVAEFPLYRIEVSGLSVGQPALLMERSVPYAGHKHSASDIGSGTLPPSRGGTGVTTDAAIALKAWPVGSVYSSYDPTSPAARFGGTWTAITGVFPYFNAGTATGGANMHTLTTAQLPKNKVYSSVWINGSAGLDDALYTGAFSQGSEYVYIKETYIGNGQSHNNMPAYQTLYAWRRTA